MALIPPFFIDCVVAIGKRNPDGKVSWIASGFFYGFLVKKVDDVNDREWTVYLVTNKHVLRGQADLVIRVNPGGAESAQDFNMPLFETNGDQLWEGHLHNAVDVAVVPIDWNLLTNKGMKVSFFQGDEHALGVKKMQEVGLVEGDFAYVLGFPMGLGVGKRNTVITRGGVIARIRETQSKATEPFLVDATVFPGNSGGPVVSKPEIVSIDGTTSISSAHLLGVVASYVLYSDVAISQQTGQARVIFQENSGLSSVFTTDCIDQTIRRHKKVRTKKDLVKSGPTPTNVSEDEEVVSPIVF